jgi:hypothetical protein
MKKMEQNNNNIDVINNPKKGKNLKDEFLRRLVKQILVSQDKNDILDDILNKENI